MRNMTAAIRARNACEIDDHENDGDDPKRDAAIKHRKDAVVGSKRGGGNGDSHYTCRCALERSAIDLS